MTFPSRWTRQLSFALLVLIPGLQLLYFCSIIKTYGPVPEENFDLVLTYSDDDPMDPALQLALSHHKTLFVSQAPWETNPFPQSSAVDLAHVYFDSKATTTDQNARHAAAFIRHFGYKKVLLDVAWFHLPRSLFLTRLYLLGSGVEVVPCMKTPTPARWWSNHEFHVELYKFWGSLGRVALASLGIETGPKGPPR